MPELEADVFPKNSVLLDVALWGRILVFDSLDIGGLLFRAERQTVLRTVAAWGAHGRLLDRGVAVARLLDAPVCLGLTRRGQPRHPLYVPAATEPVPFGR